MTMHTRSMMTPEPGALDTRFLPGSTVRIKGNIDGYDTAVVIYGPTQIPSLYGDGTRTACLVRDAYQNRKWVDVRFLSEVQG